jgi:hypothetical protein
MGVSDCTWEVVYETGEPARDRQQQLCGSISQQVHPVSCRRSLILRSRHPNCWSLRKRPLPLCLCEWPKWGKYAIARSKT